jgi:hypothetical protein
MPCFAPIWKLIARDAGVRADVISQPPQALARQHRYTTSLAVINQMLATGWVFEGNANTKVFACVPQ